MRGHSSSSHLQVPSSLVKSAPETVSHRPGFICTHLAPSPTPGSSTKTASAAGLNAHCLPLVLRRTDRRPLLGSPYPSLYSSSHFSAIDVPPADAAVAI